MGLLHLEGGCVGSLFPQTMQTERQNMPYVTALADASQPRQSALLERVSKKNFLPCLLRGQGSSKGAVE